MADLQRINGIGPFYSALIVIRASGFTDVLPRDDAEALALAGELYGLASPATAEQLTEIAEAWRPYRTWATVLIRAAASRLTSPRRRKPRRARPPRCTQPAFSPRCARARASVGTFATSPSVTSVVFFRRLLRGRSGDRFTGLGGALARRRALRRLALRVLARHGTGVRALDATAAIFLAGLGAGALALRGLRRSGRAFSCLCLRSFSCCHRARCLPNRACRCRSARARPGSRRTVDDQSNAAGFVS